MIHFWWESLVSIDPQTVTLSPGQSKDASILLNVDQAAQGDKEFTIRAVYGTAGDKAVEQKVSLSIAKSQATDYQAVVNHFKNNWFIYLIVLVNVILIIAIIIVIRRMVSSPKEYQWLLSFPLHFIILITLYLSFSRTFFTRII